MNFCLIRYFKIYTRINTIFIPILKASVKFAPCYCFTDVFNSSVLYYKLKHHFILFSLRTLEDTRQHVTSRRSYTVCSSMNVRSERKYSLDADDEEGQRPLSVCELVQNIEKSMTNVSTGAVPKRAGFKRSTERYRTQPVTVDELIARYV